MMNDSIGDLPL